MLQAIPPASSDTAGPLEDMVPGQRKISSDIENVTTPQADCRNTFCSHFLSLEKVVNHPDNFFNMLSWIYLPSFPMHEAGSTRGKHICT